MNNKAHLRPKDFDSNGDIIPMACKEEKGDLISREALKAEFSKRLWFVSSPQAEAQAIKDIIDNAPTVEPEKVLVANVTFDEDKLKDIVRTEVIEKIKSGELVIKDERPQGEWNEIQAGMLVCPFCGARPHKDFKNFCAKCGAKMQKGGAE